MDSKYLCVFVCVLAEFEALYEELNQLGKGGYGSVWAGNRKQDYRPVRVTQNHTNTSQV